MLQAESYQALIDSESEEEKQDEQAGNDTYVISQDMSESKDAKKKLVKKRKVYIYSFWTYIF